MPQVLVLDGTGGIAIERDIKARLEKALRSIVADALSVPSVEAARLTPSQVGVKTIPCRADYFDLGTNELCILVFANWFKEREEDLQSVRVPQIAARVKEILPEGFHGCVYVRLAPGGFAKF